MLHIQLFKVIGTYFNYVVDVGEGIVVGPTLEKTIITW